MARRVGRRLPRTSFSDARARMTPAPAAAPARFGSGADARPLRSPSRLGLLETADGAADHAGLSVRDARHEHGGDDDDNSLADTGKGAVGRNAALRRHRGWQPEQRYDVVEEPVPSEQRATIAVMTAGPRAGSSVAVRHRRARRPSTGRAGSLGVLASYTAETSNRAQIGAKPSVP